MKANKSVLKSLVTDKNLQATLRLIATDEFKLNIKELAHAKQMLPAKYPERKLTSMQISYTIKFAI